MMGTVLMIVLVWVGASILVGVGFSIGAAVGHRRGFEAGRDAALESASEPSWIDLTDPSEELRVVVESAPETSRWAEERSSTWHG